MYGLFLLAVSLLPAAGSTNNSVTVTWSTAGAKTVSVNYTKETGMMGYTWTVSQYHYS